MFAFFIDDWTEHRKYRRETDALDLRLTGRGLSGRKIKLTRLHDLDASVADCLRSGIKTLVAVGNDQTASKLINSLFKLAGAPVHNATVAVLPVGENQLVAQSLGCQKIEDAVEALARGRRALIDLGKLNNRHYFVTAAFFPPRVSLGFLSYTVSSLSPEHRITVCNTNVFGSGKGFRPNDGTLEAVISSRPAVSWWAKVFPRPSQVAATSTIESVFPHQKITILAKEKILSVEADSVKRLSAPVAVEIVPAALPVIVGAHYAYGYH